MAISKRLRFEILRRDNHQCRYCGDDLAPPELEDFERIWNDWTFNGKRFPLPDDWHKTVAMWLGRGLTLEIIQHCVTTAMRRKGVVVSERWRYFCGVTWRTLTELEERAEALASDERAVELYERPGLAPLREEL